MCLRRRSWTVADAPSRVSHRHTIRRLWTVADTPSHISHRRTIHRRCSRIFCTASHMVGDNKLCGIYLIFHLDLNYIMGSQRQWTVFEWLDLLSAYVHGFMLMSHPRNGDEFRTLRHLWGRNDIRCLLLLSKNF